MSRKRARYIRGPAEVRYWAKVDIRGPDECWPWMAGRDKRGYGSFRASPKTKSAQWAHRFGLSLKLGRPVADGMDTLHSCDYPPCQNPDHLSEGTVQQNLADMWAKGRGGCGRGERHRAVKLTWAKVRAIRRSRKTNTELAAKYGVAQNTVSSIRHYRTWRE